jgi:hypothetical protein
MSEEKMKIVEKRQKWSETGLPDGIFSHRKSKFGCILESLAIEDVGRCILQQFGLFYGHREYFIDIT